MSEYILSFRVHGPSQINQTGEIGCATIRPMRNQSGVTASLDFEVEADNRQQVNELAEKEYRDRARTILDVLSFVVEDGLVLGDHYDPIPADAQIQQRMDSSTNIDALVIDIGDEILETADSTLSENPRTRRALSWYNLGLSTETPEDEFIAFWTGLEAAVESQSGLDDEEEDLYESIVETIEETLSDNKEFKDRIKGVLGLVQREDTATSLQRALGAEVGYDEDELDDLRDLKDARADIVHDGKQIEDASEKAERARQLLLELLDARLSRTYDELLDPETGLPADREQSYHVAVEAEEWLSIVFDGEDGALTTQEIQRKAFALLQDIHQVTRLSVLLPKFSGWEEPLHQVGNNELRYSPSPQWVSPEVDAILRYLDGAGWVTPEVMRYNLPEIRNDVESIDAAEIEDVCEELIKRDLIEESDGYFQISLTGEMCLDGRLDPREVEHSD